MRLSDEQRLDWLQLIRSENVGPRTFRALINKFGSAAAAVRGLPELLARSAGARAVRLADRGSCEREIALGESLGARLVASGEAEYPAPLRAIDAPPPLVWTRGDAAVLQRPCVAIVGSRNASAAGLAFTDRLTQDLAAADIVVVSGLARGIDQRAHRAALRSGTIAVLAGGLDRVYPPEHQGLADEIAAQGALVSEMPLGWEPRGRDFPRRNRIVSGLSLATVVVEAARRSGSLITARFAAEQGREVFAVPGSPLDPRAEGTNDLLRQGASLCLSGRDVADALAALIARGAPEPDLFREEPGLSPSAEPLWDETDLFGEAPAPRSDAGQEFDEEEAPPPLPPPGPAPGGGGVARDGGPDLAARVAALLGPSPVTVDDLVRASGAAAADIQAALLDLELAGRLARHGGARVSTVPDQAS